MTVQEAKQQVEICERQITKSYSSFLDTVKDVAAKGHQAALVRENTEDRKNRRILFSSTFLPALHEGLLILFMISSVVCFATTVDISIGDAIASLGLTHVVLAIPVCIFKSPILDIFRYCGLVIPEFIIVCVGAADYALIFVIFGLIVSGIMVLKIRYWSLKDKILLEKKTAETEYTKMADTVNHQLQQLTSMLGNNKTI